MTTNAESRRYARGTTFRIQIALTVIPITGKQATPTESPQGGRCSATDHEKLFNDLRRAIHLLVFGSFRASTCHAGSRESASREFARHRAERSGIILY